MTHESEGYDVIRYGNAEVDLYLRIYSEAYMRRADVEKAGQDAKAAVESFRSVFPVTNDEPDA